MPVLAPLVAFLVISAQFPPHCLGTSLGPHFCTYLSCMHENTLPRIEGHLKQKMPNAFAQGKLVTSALNAII